MSDSNSCFQSSFSSSCQELLIEYLSASMNSQMEILKSLCHWRKQYDIANTLRLKAGSNCSAEEKRLLSWFNSINLENTKASRLSAHEINCLIVESKLDFLENKFLFCGWDANEIEECFIQHRDISHSDFRRHLIDRSWARALPDISDFALQYEALEEFWEIVNDQDAEDQHLVHSIQFQDEVSAVSFSIVNDLNDQVELGCLRDEGIFRLVEFQLMRICGCSLSECISKLANSQIIESRYGEINSPLLLQLLIKKLFFQTCACLLNYDDRLRFKYLGSDWLFRPLMFGIIVGRNEYRRCFSALKDVSQWYSCLGMNIGYKISLPFPWLNDLDGINAFICMHKSHLKKVSCPKS